MKPTWSHVKRLVVATFIAVFLVAGFLKLGGLNTANAAATIIYVSPTGSDANAGTIASPLRTIQKGIDMANDAINSDSDVIVHVAAGSYAAVVNIWPVFNNARSLTLEGESGTVLTGADQWNSGWTANPNGTYVHEWPYRWGAQPFRTTGTVTGIQMAMDTFATGSYEAKWSTSTTEVC